MKRILPEFLYSVIFGRLNMENLYELRLRSNKAVGINYNGKYYYLGRLGLCQDVREGILCEADLPQKIITKACESSVYNFNDEIRDGYLTLDCGVRLGVAGQVVYHKDLVTTIKDITSVVIRIPHNVEGCGEKIFSFIAEQGSIKNTLIVSPPGFGKTTMLRDLTRILACGDPYVNVLLIDERNEISATLKRHNNLNVGVNVDVIVDCDKKYAFEYGVRSMRPDVIVTDELMSREDYLGVIFAAESGVKVLASMHSGAIGEVKAKLDDFCPGKTVFERIVLLSNKSIGQINSMYDGEFRRLI